MIAAEDRRSPRLRDLVAVVRRNPGFRRLYLANAISGIGDWFSVVALFSLLLELTGRGQSIALLLVTHLLPQFLLGPIAGVVADRVPRRTILITVDLLRAGLVCSFFLVHSPDRVWLAYAANTAMAACSSFFETAQQASVPNLVPVEDLALASALENSLWSVTLACGASLGGLAVAAFGRNFSFGFDAATFLVSAALVRGLPALRAKRGTAAEADRLETVEAAHGDAADARGWANVLGLHDFLEGVRYVVSDLRVRAILVAKAGFGLTLGGVLVLLSWFGERVFSAAGGGRGIAILYTARGVGSLLGPLVAFRLVGADAHGLRRGILYAYLLILGCYLGFAASPSIAWAALFLGVANAGGSILWTYGSTLLQQIVPDRIRGRVAAAELWGMTLAMSITTLAVGHAIDLGAPPRWLMGACGLVALFPIGLWIWTQPAFEQPAVAHRER